MKVAGREFWKIWRRPRLAAALVGTAAALAGLAFWYVQSGALDRFIQAKIVEAVRQTTQTPIEFGSFHVNLARGRVEAGLITLRGREKADEPPLLRLQKLEAQLDWRIFISPGIQLRRVVIEGPQVYLRYYADGTNNLPLPKPKPGDPSPVQRLLDLRLGQLEARNGYLQLNEYITPFGLTAQDFRLDALYLTASRAYRGQVASGQLKLERPGAPSEEASGEVSFLLDAQKLSLEKLLLRRGPAEAISSVEGIGTVQNLENKPGQRLRADLQLKASMAAGEINRYVRLPIEERGRVSFEGQMLFEFGRGVELHGQARAADLYYRDPTTRMGPLAARAAVDYLPGRLTLSQLRAEAWGGQLKGMYRWDQQDGWQFDGELAALPLGRAFAAANLEGSPWSGTVAGDLRARAASGRPFKAEADLTIAAVEGTTPARGLLAVSYDEAGNRLEVRNSYLDLAHSQLRFAGTLDAGLRFDFNSTDLREWEAALRWAGWKEKAMPVELRGGRLHAAGVVRGDGAAARRGAWGRTQVKGNVEGTSFLVQGHPVTRLAGRFDYGDELLRLEQWEVDRPGQTLRGQAAAVLEDGALTEKSILSGGVKIAIGDLQPLLQEFGVATPLAGPAELSIALRGRLGAPEADGTWRSSSLEVQGESFTQVSAAFQASRRSLKAPEIEARLGGQTLKGSIDLRAGGDDWKLGAGQAKLVFERVPSGTLRRVRDLKLDWGAAASADLDTTFTWSPEGVAPSKLDGKFSLVNITRFGRPVGQLEFTSRTSGQRAALTVQGAIRQQPVKGDAVIGLGTRLETELRLQLPRLDFPSIAQLLAREPITGPLPYEGGAEASLYFKGPLLAPAEWDGALTIPQLLLAPNKDYVQETLPRVSDVVLRNEGPIVLRYSKNTLSARSVKFIAKDTNFTADFIYRVDTEVLGGRANGRINLAVLSTLQPELLASGVANLNATIAGKASDPQLNGRLAFENASFYLRNVITGLDKVNGSVLFDKSRATIETLQAQTGGGALQLTGFVGFGQTLTYRLQAQASQVRLRYPEGVSTTANANLALTGTTAQSILTGNVTILRSAIGQVDTAQFLAAGAAGEAMPESSNRYLRNLQFDVRVDAAQNVEFSTALTKDVKGEVALRLRGTPQAPILLGRMSVTQGEIDFFGSRYEINRGELLFTNPLKIEPVVNLDLETRVRGVVINLNFSGPSSKLNLNYRSDPPLQSSEILALLTVGRNPNSSSSSSVAQTQGQTQGLFGNDSSVFLGAAVSAGINGRLQRFFGISRVRLDPQLTGIDNVPQARLTLEQQVSRDVTLTYITNLNRTQQQIVRLDWDISKTWSVVAVRDENGIFGVDLFFRKRLK